MQPSFRIPRRRFLQGAGAALALPWLEGMTPTARAVAANDGPPLRLACLFQPNGVYPKHWDVRGGEHDFQLSPILEPLANVRKNVLIVSGLDNVGVRGHVQMTGAFLTGNPIKDARNAPSLDQLVARQIGGDTRLPSIQLGTEPPRQGGSEGEPISLANTVSWVNETTRLNPEINPRVAFDQLFRQQTDSAARRQAEDHQSVVDLVLEDAKRLRRQTGARDQRKLDEYLQSVREVEVRLDRALNPPPRSWNPPTQPKLAAPADGIPVRRDEHLRLMMDILLLAFWTDSTRVATLMTAHGFSRQNFSFLEGVTSDHHGMSHHKNQETAIAEYTTVSRWYISQLSYLLERMQQIDEGPGSLLDHSIVLYGSGMKDGNGHVKNDLPIILAGGGHGALRTGRHVTCKPGTPLANLLLTLGQKCGLEIDSMNGASTGTLSELL